MPYYNVKTKILNFFGNFDPLIEHGPHWINYIILTFITKNNRYHKGLYKIWNKIISFDVKQKVKCNIMLGPPSEFPSVFGYLIENQYTLEHSNLLMFNEK
jgi:hypothetical protein